MRKDQLECNMAKKINTTKGESNGTENRATPEEINLFGDLLNPRSSNQTNQAKRHHICHDMMSVSIRGISGTHTQCSLSGREPSE